MAAKRTATTELDHNNWDNEDDAEEAGSFQTASKEELSRRVIRTGRRRTPGGIGVPQEKSVFSAFSGFNKPAPSSFDFLSNLTNGAASSNGSSTFKKDESEKFVVPPTSTTSTTIGSLLNNDASKAITTNAGSLFGTSNTITSMPSMFAQTSNSSNENKKSFTFGTASNSPSSKPTMMFGIPPMSSEESTKSFGTQSKTSSPVLTFGIPPKSQPTSDAKTTSIFASSKSEVGSLSTSKPPLMFGTSAGSSENKNNSIFGIPTTSSTPTAAFKLPLTSTPLTFNTGSKTNDAAPAIKRTKSEDKHELNSPNNITQYYSKLKGLNESVSEWIRKHVNENPLCILTPIFKDYENYLKELEIERAKEDITVTIKKDEPLKKTDVTIKTITPTVTSSMFSSNIAAQTNANASIPKLTGLTATSSTTAPLFSFGATTTTPLTTAASSVPTPFSFGTGGNFTFNAVQKPQEQSEEQKDDNDEPPKIEYNPIAEENSVFDKKCKIFFKKDGEFVDKGVGTLYIKTVPNSSKHQIIVRANTTLGTIFLNFILSDSIPAQRMGKNNVMVVCIPTPESKPPPIPVLIRVKTSEEADNLLDTINKYKK